MGQKVLINVEPEDIRVAVLEEGVLTDLFIENRHEKTIVGDIYKGIVTDVVPGIQAAFVDFGLDRNAFLHVQDLPPQDGDEPYKLRGRRRGREGGNGGKKMNIADYLKPGQRLMVQAIKDGIGEKGPRLSQFISMPGRYLVLLPNQVEDDSGGVSRRIEDGRERSRLRRLMEKIDFGDGSMILRTAAVDADDKAIEQDGEFLKTSWDRVKARAHKEKAPALLHSDYDILYRLVRDVFTDNIDEIAIDDTREHANLVTMLKQYLPSLKNRVLLYPSTRNIFEVFDIERQVYKALRKRVWLRSGGHLVFDECEALTAIDVNTGKFIGREDQEATVLRTNLESARVIARQLKLRDIGGIIVIDFIDMQRREHREEVLRDLKRCLRMDRARTTVSDFTNLGTIEMTRKRVRHSLRKTLLRECPTCGGNGMILSDASTWRLIRNAVLSLVEEHANHDIHVKVHPDLLARIKPHHREAFSKIEDDHGIKIAVEEGDTGHCEQYVLEAWPSEVPMRARRAGGKDMIRVAGKRFSGSEVEEQLASRPQRRRSARVRGRGDREDKSRRDSGEEDVQEENEGAAAEAPGSTDVVDSEEIAEAELLFGETLSGRLTRAEEVATNNGDDEEAPPSPRTGRRRSRGGRGRRRRRRGGDRGEATSSQGISAEGDAPSEARDDADLLGDRPEHIADDEMRADDEPEAVAADTTRDDESGSDDADGATIPEGRARKTTGRRRASSRSKSTASRSPKAAGAKAAAKRAPRKRGGAKRKPAKRKTTDSGE